METMQQTDTGRLTFVNGNDAVNDLIIGGPVPTAADSRIINERVLVRKLTASDAAGGVLSILLSETILVTKVVIAVTTVSTGACTIDVGFAATSVTNDSLIDGLDVNAATGVFDNITDKGTNGKSRQLVASTKYITATKASGATAGLVGYAYIHYYPTF